MWKTKTEAFETRGEIIHITCACANDHDSTPEAAAFSVQYFSVDVLTGEINAIGKRLAHLLKCVSEGGGLREN